jgi:ferredoxin-type protein NapG
MAEKNNIKTFLNNNPFKGFFRKNKLRPPGAVSEEKFVELCIRCSRCVEVCPYNSILREGSVFRLRIGVPIIDVTEKACYLCMKCPSVCPTGALNPNLKKPENVKMGIAVINETKCHNYVFAKDEISSEETVSATICSTCYNVCPFPDKAIVLKQMILPVVTEYCTGCGICTERCPVEPKAINILPSGMEDKDKAGFYYQKSRKIYQHKGNDKQGVYSGEELLNKKKKMSSGEKEPEFKYDFEIQNSIEDWD